MGQVEDDRMSYENEPKEFGPRISWFYYMLARVRQVIIEDQLSIVEEIVINDGISLGSMHTISEDLKMQKVSFKRLPQMLTES